MTRIRRTLIVALGVAALAVPAGAIANHGESHGKGHAKGKTKTHNVAYVFKGTYAGESSVDVTKGNAHARKADLVGETVLFDLTEARIVVPDNNGDGERTLDDVAVGDKVVVKARLPKGDPGDQPLEAKRLIDQTRSSDED